MDDASKRFCAEARRQLEWYAGRGVFQGLSIKDGSVRQAASTLECQLLWHRGRSFSLTVNARRRTLLLRAVLPGVPSGSALDRDFRALLRRCRAPSQLAHRRIDPAKATIVCVRQSKDLSLRVSLRDGNLAYAIERLIHFVQHTYLLFLSDGIYQDYRIAQLGAEADCA